MTDIEIALNAAIFAATKIEVKGSTAYAVKDRSGTWHQMKWSAVITKLYRLLEELPVINRTLEE